MEDTSSSTSSPATTVKNTVCYICTTGVCPIDVHFQDGVPVDVDLRGVPCPKGKAQIDFVLHPNRIKYPMARVGERGEGKFQRISWDDALDKIAGKLLKIKEEYGPESVVFFVGYTKEPRPYIERLAHAFGTPNICTESSLCFSATYLAASVTYGKGYEWFISSGAVHPATKVQLIWTSNPPFSQPNTARALWEARNNGQKLIVVDPRVTETAAKADIHLQLRPGTDGALALGMMNVIIRENLYDREFVQNWTVGFDDLVRLVQEYTPERAAEITHVPAEKIVEAARLYATSKPAKIRMSASSTVHATNGVQSHRAIILLPALTGNLDVPGGNAVPRPAMKINEIALHDEHTGEFKSQVGYHRFPLWCKTYKEGHSLALADQIQSGKPYPIKALVGVGTNVMMVPNTKRLVEALKSLDLLVFSDYHSTITTDLADIVLPASTHFETPALIAGWPHSPFMSQLRWREPIIDPIGESWPDWKFMFELGKRLGLGDLFWGGDFEKCIEHVLEPSGYTLSDVKAHPEGIRLLPPQVKPKRYEEHGFVTPSGKVEIRSSILEQHGFDGLPVFKEPLESPVSRPDIAQEYPLVLTTGARLPMFTHSRQRDIPRLRKLMPDPLVEIHPQDAEARSISNGDAVTLSTRRGTITVKANVTTKILPGVVSMSHGWKEANVNQLIDDKELDPISGFPGFKSQLCQVAKL